jgi:transcriptional regulator with XRE-family HTH domain
VDFARQLAEVLRRTRTTTGLTHRQMARRLGISHATYTRLENANQNVTLKTLTQLCRVLDCDMGGLFRGDVHLSRTQRRHPRGRG